MRLLLVTILMLAMLPFSVTAAEVKHHVRPKHHVTHKKAPAKKKLAASTETIQPTVLEGYNKYPSNVKSLIEKSLLLSTKRLNYIFGSANPKNGGLDCSGTIYYLLNGSRYDDFPRQAADLFSWVESSGNLHTVSSRNLESSDFDDLKPGDLLFWSGTYRTRHTPPITHVMLYLGKDKDDKPLMFGASSAGTFDGKHIRGVSVYDFRLPKGNGRAKFVGYGCIPKLTC